MVVVDEVHERCTEVDLLLLVLAKVLAANKLPVSAKGCKGVTRLLHRGLYSVRLSCSACRM